MCSFILDKLNCERCQGFVATEKVDWKSCPKAGKSKNCSHHSKRQERTRLTCWEDCTYCFARSTEEEEEAEIAAEEAEFLKMVKEMKKKFSRVEILFNRPEAPDAEVMRAAEVAYDLRKRAEDPEDEEDGYQASEILEEGEIEKGVAVQLEDFWKV